MVLTHLNEEPEMNTFKVYVDTNSRVVKVYTVRCATPEIAQFHFEQKGCRVIRVTAA